MGDVTDLPGISIHEWVRRLWRRLGRHMPMFASLEFTERCNLRCAHCYINRPAGDEDARRSEMTLEEWQGLLDQMAQAGVLWLLVTGGEPLLRPDFPDFYLYAKKKGFHVILFTNGTLLTPEIADLLAHYPPWEVEITLYGATAPTYESVTGVPGSYARCRRGIELLRERGVSMNLKTMALTLNAAEIPAMQAMCDGWGLRFRYDPMVHARLDGDPRPSSVRLSPEEIIALERADPKRLQQWQDLCAKVWGPPDREHLFTCGAAANAFHVGAYGEMYPCLMARWLRYDLRSGSLSEALDTFLPAVRRLPATRDRTCWECDARVLCQNCPGWSYSETGDPEAPEPFHCLLTRLRQQDQGLAVRILTEEEYQMMMQQQEGG